jgi:hypothetical protein
MTAMVENKDGLPSKSARLIFTVEEVGCNVGGLPRVLTTTVFMSVDDETAKDIRILLTPHVTATPLSVHNKLLFMMTGVGMSIAIVPEGLPLGMVKLTVKDVLALFIPEERLIV